MNVVDEVQKERAYQRERWGDRHDDEHGVSHLLRHANERVALASDRNELIEAAALIVAAIETIDRTENA